MDNDLAFMPVIMKKGAGGGIRTHESLRNRVVGAAQHRLDEMPILSPAPLTGLGDPRTYAPHKQATAKFIYCHFASNTDARANEGEIVWYKRGKRRMGQ